MMIGRPREQQPKFWGSMSQGWYSTALLFTYWRYEYDDALCVD